MIQQEIDEQPGLGRHVASILKCQVDREPGQIPIVQYRQQSAGHQVVVDDVLGLNEYPCSRQRRGPNDLTIIGFQGRLNLHRYLLISLGKLHGVGMVGMAVDKNVVIHELLYRLRGAFSLQVFGRGRQHATGFR
ncbi:hypothetical protein D9M69_607300 [compost metagenome]